ncbi:MULTISPECIES: MFS transporter [Kocuria]|uniref:MFS transporter n=1 Tax=Kocuria TaxID=57493 RepID=UPI00203B7283|nr:MULTISPECIES: MFS transporter [Kocuria]MCM3686421.1 MFS transporter [Kocuria rosea]HST71442.1 MFS transporter [Kocuria rosea]
MDAAPPAPSSARPAAPFVPDRRHVWAWSLWDVGSAAFNAVMTTFVFTVYLTGEPFGGEDHASEVLGYGMGAAGVLVALLAPVVGQRSDGAGRRKLWLGVNTMLTALLTALCFFVYPQYPFLWLGVGLLALANVFDEFAVVNYNAMLPGLAGREHIGRVSGQGWAMGYFGGIVALTIVLFGFITPGLLGLPEEDALNVRAVALFSGLWIALFSVPVLLTVPEARPVRTGPRPSVLRSYRQLGATLRELWRDSPQTLRFLLASAVFRDGLNAVFTFGGVLAAGTFGFSLTDVIVFAIVGNVAAGAGALVGGRLDDRVGPRRVIVVSLVGVIAAGTPLLVLDGTAAFWVCGLLLCLFVGPAQSASRTFLGRLTSAGHEGALYGLYATTGRAVSFLAPTLFAVFVSVLGAQRWGILGILLVVAAGTVLLLGVRPPEDRRD